MSRKIFLLLVIGAGFGFLTASSAQALPTTVIISGTVTDIQTNWPLYSGIYIEDNINYEYFGTIWSDPLTGYYEVSVPLGGSYDFYVYAWIDGYFWQYTPLGPVMGDITQNFALEIDPSTCTAPGYQFADTVYFEDFEAGNGGFTVGGINSSWEWGMPISGPGAAHSGANAWGTDLEGDYLDGEDGSLTSPPIDLSAFAGQPITVEWWQYLATASWEDSASVEVSKDGGASWETVYGPIDGGVDLNWGWHPVTLDPSYAVSNFQVRFHFISNGEITMPGWYIEDISIHAGACQAPAGGLVVGQVFAEDFIMPLTGARVSNNSGEAATARTTDDPALADAFYTLYSPGGTHVFTGTMTGCNPVAESVDVIEHGAVEHNFYLPSGALVADPAGLSVSLDMGMTATLQLSLANLGERDLSFQVREDEIGFKPLSYLHTGKSTLTQTKILYLVTSYMSGSIERALTELGYQSDQYWTEHWTEIDFSPYDVVVVAINDGWGYIHAHDVEKIRRDVIDAGKRAIFVGGTCFQDFVEGVNAYLVASDVSDNCWKISDQPHWSLVNAGHPLADGLPESNNFLEELAAQYQGRVTDANIETIAVNGDGFPAFFYKRDFFPEIAGDIQPSRGDFIWFINSPSDFAWPNRVDFNILKQLLANAVKYRVMDEAPWLSEAPVSGAIPGGGELINRQVLTGTVIDVTFDAIGSQPGDNLANLILFNDTPYGALEVPVTMTISAPLTWGKLEGTINSLGSCDANPAPLGGAVVEIESDSGMLWTLETDDAGSYSHWLDEGGSPYTVTVSAAGHEEAVHPGVIIQGQQTTPLSFDLRWLMPCLDTDPSGLAISLELGAAGTLPLTLTNSGAREANFALTDEQRGSQGTVLVVEDEPDVFQGMEAALAELGVPFTPISNVDFDMTPVEDLLDYRAVFYAGLSWWGGLPYFHIIEYLDGGGRFYIADNDLGYFQGNTPLYTEYLQATWETDDGGDILAGEDIMAGLAVDTSRDPYPDGFSVGAQGIPIFTFTESGLAAGVRVERNGYKAVHTAWDFVYVTPTESKEVVSRVLAYLTDDAAWLSQDPINGAIPADGGSQTVEVGFDALRVTEPGEQYADLVIWSNDPLENPFRLPVTMTVSLSPDYGQLVGAVGGLGDCDANRAPLARALVTVESDDGMSWSTRTEMDGSYDLWLGQDHSPYTVTVSAPEHETGIATEVIIVGQGATTQDFDLRWLAPCVSAAPTSLAADVVAGQSVTVPLTLFNDGAGPTAFKLHDFQPGIAQRAPGLAGGQGEWLHRSTKGMKMRNNRGEISLAYPSAYHWRPAVKSDLNVLVYADDFFHSYPDTFLDQALRGLGIEYTAHYDGDYYYFLKDLENGDWDMVLFGNDMWWNPQVFLALTEYVLRGGRLAIHTWMMSGALDDPLWATLGVEWSGDDESPPDPIYWWQPDHPIFTDPESVPEFTELQERLVYNGQYVEPLPGFEALAGFTTPGPDPNQAALVLGNDNRTIFKGFIDSSNDADRDGDGMMDGVELWMDMITLLENSLGSDTPWLSETPITGTLAADGSMDVSVSFNALDYPIGSYEAVLTIQTADPLIEIPVSMRVTPVVEPGMRLYLPWVSQTARGLAAGRDVVHLLRR